MQPAMSTEETARQEREDRKGSGTPNGVSGETQDDRGPPGDERFHHLGCGIRADSAIAHHGEPPAAGAQIVTPRSLGNEIRQRCRARIVRTLRIEINNEGGAGSSAEGQRCNRTEHSVLR